MIVRQVIPAGHKVALIDIPAGGSVIKYGAPIGTRDGADSAGSARAHAQRREHTRTGRSGAAARGDAGHD